MASVVPPPNLPPEGMRARRPEGGCAELKRPPERLVLGVMAVLRAKRGGAARRGAAR
jgi:hypothetical protein